LHVLELILLLLATTAVVQYVSERVPIPVPALLVIVGLILALIPGLPDVELDPDTVFLVFVPPLVYWAALNTSLRDFRRNLRSITLLGVGLVLFTMVVVAVVAHTFIPGMTWGAGFVLGAIVSPPDAIAVTSITRRIGVPQVIATILDGESLVNDAAALVAYKMAVAAVVTGAFSLSEAGLRLVWTAAGGIAFGLLVGWLIVLIRKRVGLTPVVENTISLLTPFAVYIPAEALGLASVLAVVANGLYLGRRGPRVIGAATRLQARAMWEVVVFLLEGLVFIIIGFELPVVRKAIQGDTFKSIIEFTLLISGVLIATRLLWVFPSSYIPRFIRRCFGKPDTYPPVRHVLFVGWAGMRGADSLVIALALPLTTAAGVPFPDRPLIIYLTFAVILITLVIQGITLAPLIRLLGLHADDVDAKEEAMARIKTARAGLRRLNSLARSEHISPGVIDELREQYRHRISEFQNRDGDNAEGQKMNDHASDLDRLRLEMIAAEREEVVRLRDQEIINDTVLRMIQRDLDIEEVLISGDGERVEDEPEEAEAGGSG
jgi:Na+/H+ antiporter